MAVGKFDINNNYSVKNAYCWELFTVTALSSIVVHTKNLRASESIDRGVQRPKMFINSIYFSEVEFQLILSSVKAYDSEYYRAYLISIVSSVNKIYHF